MLLAPEVQKSCDYQFTGPCRRYRLADIFICTIYTLLFKKFSNHSKMWGLFPEVNGRTGLSSQLLLMISGLELSADALIYHKTVCWYGQIFFFFLFLWSQVGLFFLSSASTMPNFRGGLQTTVPYEGKASQRAQMLVRKAPMRELCHTGLACRWTAERNVSQKLWLSMHRPFFFATAYRSILERERMAEAQYQAFPIPYLYDTTFGTLSRDWS